MTTSARAGRWRRLGTGAAKVALLTALALDTTGCIEELLPGEFGNFRYVDIYRGAPPALGLYPPVSDRDGNAYVLWNGLELEEEHAVSEVRLNVGHAGGGWTGSCYLDPPQPQDPQFPSDHIFHGFVGRAQGRAWFWMDQWLTGASGRTGGCFGVLRTAPSSPTKLHFYAVVPWVRETPTRTTIIGWLWSNIDAVPYQVVIDLNTRKYIASEEFQPDSATDIAVLGVGANPDEEEGVVVVRYTHDTVVRTEARFMDKDGVTFDEVSIGGLDTLPAYGIVGFLQSSDAGLYAGLDVEGQLLVLDHSGGDRQGIGGMTPVGVHKWEGELYLVGENNGKPKIAHIDDDGDIGKVRTWDASEAAADALDGKIEVIDDRSLPSTLTTWKSPRTAIGSHPFLHPHSLDHYADGTTTWLVAGPGWSTAGTPNTAVAYAPVGISYE
ncbi:MAG: hypothetical protein JRI68_34695 [Deltaproteobacteria bacterium]|nr:hypothetical protein [Deltaproteobacteria bacterium]